MPRTRKSLPAVASLAFRAPQGFDIADPDELSEVLRRAANTRIEYRPATKKEPFRSVYAVAGTDRMQLFANSALATHYSCSSSSEQRGLVIIPFLGHGLIRCDGQSVAWGGGQAVYHPSDASSGEATPRSLVGVYATFATLQALARTMLGADSSGVPDQPLDLSKPRSLDLDVAGVQFGQIFRHHMELLNAMGGDGERMQRSGLDDMMLRAITMLLAPERFLADDPVPPRTDGRVAEVCDYICANLDRKITLTDLESLSGLSARSLQHRFRAAFGRTPMQWLTDQRLAAVRQRILSATPGITLTEIASPYFGNLGDFARQYRERFGERPSETLQRIQRKRLKT
ncbi:AraC family transcriptional regulator [Lichenifustis flavocetrariae]|uniref:AraC family transcriptional regulator n=1 Tax=Lichenifustis flavocetrariae TaxID=2949735 RepID=A0AA41Z8V6_9HYPH|nr:AraC family transcriptional regulator [Lichenifustis flavocetrariae]MCW6512460.1 AraC family transcriptional regulator [Lichenifustis flavocetrariae]